MSVRDGPPPGDRPADAGSGDGGVAAPSIVVTPPEVDTWDTQQDACSSEDKPASSAKSTAKKPFGGFLDKIDIDLHTLKLMFKGSLPPIIATSIYQAPAISSFFLMGGYEISIIAVMAIAILPRGKYLQTVLLNLLAVLLGSALSMLMLFSGVHARLASTDPNDYLSSPLPTAGSGNSPTTLGANRPPYNSSQSAVCAVWLFAATWFVNMVRARSPSFNVPAIVFSILVNISATSGTTILTATAAWEQLVRRLMFGMLLALAIATGVSLLVFPLSSRIVVVRQLSKGVGLLRDAVRLQGEYLHGLERGDMFALHSVQTTDLAARTPAGKKAKRRFWKKKNDDEKKKKKNAGNVGGGDGSGVEDETAAALKKTILQLRSLAGQMQGDIEFAKREFAWGKLDARDLHDVFKLWRAIFIPVMGMATTMDIFRRTAQQRGWTTDEGEDVTEELLSEKLAEKRMWNGLMKQLHEPFAILSEAIDEGLEHAAVQLEILPRRQRKKIKRKAADAADADVEAGAGYEESLPGETEFSRKIEEKIQLFYSRKGDVLRYWTREIGRNMTASTSLEDSPAVTLPSPTTRERSQSQLNVLLYMEQLMYATGEAVHDLVLFADAKASDGTMSSSRFLSPGARRMRKWVKSVFHGGGGGSGGGGSDSTADEAPDLMERGSSIVHLGDSFSGRKHDPEHLPPATRWEAVGDRVRAFSRLLASDQSAFGLRAACANLTVGIFAFLQHTQVFFQEQRLVWAMVIISIGMTQTSGQSIFSFSCRLGGSLVAMVSSFFIWYAAAQKTAAVIVLLWLSIFIDYYFYIKNPRFTPAVTICVVSQVIIIGYALQVSVLGIQQAESTGQPYYPTYLLAPYRVATVAGGIAVAFFWTVFPNPSTDRTWMRRDLSATLYLLANYFSAITQTIRVQLQEEEETGGDAGMAVAMLTGSPGSPVYRRLGKVRHRIFGKLMLLLPSLEAHALFQKWELTIGGRFPREIYDEILLRSSRILNYLTLLSYTATHPPHLSVTASPNTMGDAHWQHTLQTLLDEVQPAHASILSTLTLLSNSLLSGQSLPPFILLPQPSELAHRVLPLLSPHPHKKAPTENGLDDDDDDSDGSSSSGSSGDSLASELENPSWGYTEFAVMQVCSALVRDDLQGLVAAVERLVGVVDFSFRPNHGGPASPHSSPHPSMSSSAESPSPDRSTSTHRTHHSHHHHHHHKGTNSLLHDDEDEDDDDDDGRSIVPPQRRQTNQSLTRGRSKGSKIQ